MTRDDLHRTLDALHTQLEAADSIDEQAREHLWAAMEEIRIALARADAAPAVPAADGPKTGVIDRLRGSVEQLEEEHPVLTKTLVELIATLRRMGF